MNTDSDYFFKFHFKNRAVLLVDPIGKPRILRGERSEKAEKWRNFKKNVQHLKQKLKLNTAKISENVVFFVFYVTPPHSWSEKKRHESMGQEVKVKPDVDNYLKAIMDSLWKDDGHLSTVIIKKVYGIPGRIEIFY